MNSPTRLVSPTESASGQPQRYRVVSAAFMDPDDANGLNSYATFEDARAAAECMVQRELIHLYQPGMSAERWFEDYMDFGDDPWIRPCPTDEKGQPIFSAWKYADKLVEKWNAPADPKRS